MSAIQISTRKVVVTSSNYNMTSWVNPEHEISFPLLAHRYYTSMKGIDQCYPNINIKSCCDTIYDDF